MEEDRNLADVLSWVSSAQDEVLRRRQRVGRHPGYNNDFDITWLRHSPAEELQLVLGGSDAPINVDDWKAHCTFSGGYHPDDQVVRWFWQALREFDSVRRAATLSFFWSWSCRSVALRP